MPKISALAALRVVKTGLLGVGEDHLKPDGRYFVLTLIKLGLVNDLYIEIPQSGTTGLLLYKKDSLAKNQDHEAILTGLCRSAWKNSVPLGRVIAAAWKKNLSTFVGGVDAEAASESVDAMNARRRDYFWEYR